MLLIAFAALAAGAAFALGYALAASLGRRRLSHHARRARALNDDLERRLIKLGAGLGIGA